MVLDLDELCHSPSNIDIQSKFDPLFIWRYFRIILFFDECTLVNYHGGNIKGSSNRLLEFLLFRRVVGCFRGLNFCEYRFRLTTFPN